MPSRETLHNSEIKDYSAQEILKKRSIERAAHPETDVFDGNFDYFNGYPTAESFLKVYGGLIGVSRMRLLEDIMHKLHIVDPDKAHPIIVVDYSMPVGVGGYFDASNPDCITINPINLLMSTHQQLFHIIQHETDHYCGIYEETITDALTNSQRQERGFEGESGSGYLTLTELLEDRIGQMSSQELLDLIVINDDEATLLNFLEEILISPMLEMGKDFWNREKLEEMLQAGWAEIQKLFPRLLHSYFRTGAGPHESAHALQPNAHLVTALTMRMNMRLAEAGKIIEGIEI